MGASKLRTLFLFLFLYLGFRHSNGEEFNNGEEEFDRGCSVDNQAPSLICPLPTTLRGNHVLLPKADVSVYDTCDSSPKVTQNPQAGTYLSPGSYKVNVVATDKAGNSASCIWDVYVDVPKIEQFIIKYKTRIPVGAASVTQPYTMKFVGYFVSISISLKKWLPLGGSGYVKVSFSNGNVVTQNLKISHGKKATLTYSSPIPFEFDDVFLLTVESQNIPQANVAKIKISGQQIW